MRKKTATVTKDVTSAQPTNGLQASVPPSSGSFVQTHEPLSVDAVRLRAFLKWQGAGRPGGDGVRFWLEAEQELRQTK
jgi:hypothetical protein